MSCLCQLLTKSYCSLTACRFIACNFSLSYMMQTVHILCCSKKYATTITGVVVGGCFFIGLTIIAILALRRQLVKAEENKLRLTAKISGVIPCEVSITCRILPRSSK